MPKGHCLAACKKTALRASDSRGSEPLWLKAPIGCQTELGSNPESPCSPHVQDEEDDKSSLGELM